MVSALSRGAFLAILRYDKRVTGIPDPDVTGPWYSLDYTFVMEQGDDRLPKPPITEQAKMLKVSRGSVYYLPRSRSLADLALMRRMDEFHLDFPFAGSRMLRDLLIAEGFQTGR